MINTVSVTDLKQNTAQILKRVKTAGKPTVVLQRSQAAAVLVDPEYYSLLEQALEDLADIQAIEERKNETVVSFEKVAKKNQVMNLFFVKSAEKELLDLPKILQKRILQKIKLLGNNPYSQGAQKLAGGKGYRIRLGDYRIVYSIDKPQKLVTIIKIAHRREVYK